MVELDTATVERILNRLLSERMVNWECMEPDDLFDLDDLITTVINKKLSAK